MTFHFFSQAIPQTRIGTDWENYPADFENGDETYMRARLQKPRSQVPDRL